MGETLLQPCHVSEEGLRVVKICQGGKTVMVPPEEATANYVPAAAVIRRWRALFGITGRKGSVGGKVSLM